VADRVRAYIGLGANVGDAKSALTAAVPTLGALPGAHVRGVSRLYRTKPVGVTDQPDFLNAVVALDVPAGPDPAAGASALLMALKAMERAFGREQRVRWGPRELDLDLLVFGRARLAIERPADQRLATATLDPTRPARLLEVPHPSMAERLFVLAPLAELAPRLVPPGWHETVETARRRRLRLEGPGAVVAVGEWSLEEGTWIGPTGGAIEVRPAAPGDADEAARAHSASAEAAYRGKAPIRSDGLARRTRLWRELLAGPPGRGFVATDAGRIVGVLYLGPSNEEPTVGAVRVIYVRPAWWGTGAGQALMERAHEVLAADYDEAELTVLEANPRARRFYERNGWRLVETLVEGHFGGRPTRVARYRRRLRTTLEGDPQSRFLA
jgi:2-amino-4-hydroxy-6-hydroxymethyldihydropteridine diphosphokinase